MNTTCSNEQSTSSPDKINWDKFIKVHPNEKTHETVLPAYWDNPEDDGLYDDVVNYDELTSAHLSAN